MIKRTCPNCLTRWYSSDTSNRDWICQSCGTTIPKSEETLAENKDKTNN